MFASAIWPAPAGLAAIVLLVSGASKAPQNATLAPALDEVAVFAASCPTVSQREDFEGGDCFQATRYALLEGRISLVEALKRMEACQSARAEVREMAAASRALRAEEYVSYLAWGIPTDSLHLWSEARANPDLAVALRERADRRPADAIRLLRLAGISPNGIAPGQDRAAPIAWARREGVRNAAEGALGPLHAAALQQLGGGGSAVLLGRSVLLPSAASADSAAPWRALPLDVYTRTLIARLREVEAARLSFLGAAAEANQSDSSIRALFASIRRFGRGDPAGAERSARVERSRAKLEAQVARLQGELHPPPLVLHSVTESVALAEAIAESCAQDAAGRGRLIRTGFGVLSGLVFAAGVVVATGATGTLLGGITIAAALEASAGAYWLARTEHLETPIVATGELTTVQPDDPDEREFLRPEMDLAAGDGALGDGEGDFAEWFDDAGSPEEREDGAIGDPEEASDDATEEIASIQTALPVLPVDLPAEFTRLPAAIDRALRRSTPASLPEIRDRLDDFLDISGPVRWAALEEEIAEQRMDARQMIDEAQAALGLWRDRKELHPGFGPFFVNAEAEAVDASGREEVRHRALARYLDERGRLLELETVEDLRAEIARRLVARCRVGEVAGDLTLRACSDETSLSILLVAAVEESGVPLPASYDVGVQAFEDHFEAVLFSRATNQVFSLTRGERWDGVVAPIYYPATFYYAYLVSHSEVPDIDFDEHLVAMLPNRAMPEPAAVTECREEERSTVGRAVEWLGSLVGVRRLSESRCGGRERRARRQTPGGGVNIDLALPMPSNPLRGGNGQSGGGQGGGGGGGSTLAGPGAQTSSGGGSDGGDAGSGDGGAARDGAEQGGGTGTQGRRSRRGRGGSGGSGDGADSNAVATAAASGDADAAGSGGAGSGYGLAGIPAGPNLTQLGWDAVTVAELNAADHSDRVAPWRLREDQGMAAASATRVLFADNARALERFDEDDLFITLAPAQVEAQRRMLEADGYPIFPASTTCESPDLPPRRVFRRAATGESGFRYVYCDQDEAMVIFRDREDAESYARLAAPDRPLYLARLAAERLERFERSQPVLDLRAFLADPGYLDGKSKDRVYAMVKAAGDLVVFQNALESALVQSMNELGESSVRAYYYDLHRQVLQAPLFARMVQDVYRLNRRLASDPLQSLAWADARGDLARRGFFDLYHVTGQMMEWPDRWGVLEERYGNGVAPGTADEIEPLQLDFLQITADPERVRIAWNDEARTHPAIRDRHAQDGVERTAEVVERPTASDLLEQQNKDEHRRGGTGGLGRSGDGQSMGPDRGSRPLQMLRIRIAPDQGDPDRPAFPDDNEVRPGGTEGGERRQTRESASRQEPFVWVSPETLAEALLSPWAREPAPLDAAAPPPLLRFTPRLREIFLEKLYPEGVYENRLLDAMTVFAEAKWADFAETREAMGGEWVTVAAAETGRFSAAYSGDPPINDSSQIRVPNFFVEDGVLVPADLFPALRDHYGRAFLGIFELQGSIRASEPTSLATVRGGDPAQAAGLVDRLERLREERLEAN